MNPRPKRHPQGFFAAAQGVPPVAVVHAGASIGPIHAGGPRTTTAVSHQGVFQEAVRTGDACGLQRLLEELQNKVDVNCYNNDGQTALHQSCQDGNLELVKLLIQFGADVRLANRDGWSALHIAAWSGHRDIAMYLINAYKR